MAAAKRNIFFRLSKIMEVRLPLSFVKPIDNFTIWVYNNGS